VNFPFYIARRYLISKKSHNIINIISGISVAGVGIVTMALIIILSVYNGFEKLVRSLFNSFDPDLKITAVTGKTFTMSAFPAEKLKAIPGVISLTEIIEENALLRYKDKQYIATLKGVSGDYERVSGIGSMMEEGRFQLQDGETDFAVMGYGVAATLGLNLNDYLNPVSIYVPRRTASFTGGLEQAFNTEVVFPSGYFAIQQEYDVKYVFLPLRFVRKLLEYDEERTAVEITLAKGLDESKIQQQVEQVLGSKYQAKNRYQQQEVLYNVMRSEKWAIFLILGFILLIATFNVVGSLSMLILDKKKDIAILQSLGASRKTTRQIFLAEGMLISFAGAVLGLLSGAVICWVQIRFGLVRMGSEDSTFIVNAYPVDVQVIDFVVVFATVMAVGAFAAWYPVHNIRKIHAGLIKQE
jgi:lipoprotein-releasing system permease protein